MGDDEAKDTTVVADDTHQEAGGRADSAAAAAPAPAQGPAAEPAAAPPKAEQTTSSSTAAATATSDEAPDAATSSPKKEGSSAPTTPVKADNIGTDKKASNADENTAATDDDQDDPAKASTAGSVDKPLAIVALSKRSRPPFKYDPNKISLRFIFANRDGLTVTVECNPSDTVGEVKGALLSVWPEDLPNCEEAELLRLVCMGKGFLMPDTRTLEDCQIPIFKTHPTPVNVAVKPSYLAKGAGGESPSKGPSGGDSASNNGANAGAQQTGQGCACVII